MGAVGVEQLLADVRRDAVVPVSYSRRSFPFRWAPAITLLLVAVSVVALGVVLGRL